MTTFDVVIIGGGSAGLSAGFYAGRLNLSVLIIEKERFGGKITEAATVENYPGFPEGISGPKLASQLFAQASRWGVQTRKGEVVHLDLTGEKKLINTSSEEAFSALAVIIAGGAEYRRLDVPGEADLIGEGVSFCAFCDGPSMGGKTVAVVGSGDGGLSQSLHLLQFADKIIVIEKFPQLTASPVLVNRALSDPRISFNLSTVVEAVEKVDGGLLLHLRSLADGEGSTVPVGGVFIAIGLVPNTGYLKDAVRLDEKEGWIIVDSEMRTNLPGVFAAGDIRVKSPRQAVSAVADGVSAAISAFRFIKEEGG